MDINIHNIRSDNVKTIIWVYICTNNILIIEGEEMCI